MSVYKRNNHNGHSWMMDFVYIDPVSQRQKRLRRIAKGVTTQKQALSLERKLREQLTTPPPPPEKQQKDARLADFAPYWLETRRPDWKPTAYRGYEQIVRNHLIPRLGPVVVRGLTVEEIQKLKAVLLKARSPKTVNNVLGVLSSMCEDAVRWRYADANPVRSVRKCRSTGTPDQFNYWTREDSEAFLAAIDELRPDWKAFFLTALRTGMRLGELAALRWTDVDLERARINVRRSYSHGEETLPKSGKGRTLPMSPQLRLALAEHKLAIGARERVFLSDGDLLLDHNRVKRVFWHGTKKAGVKRIRIHDLRHSFASQLVMAGVSLYKVQKLLGHQDVKTTMRYAHLSPESQADAVMVSDPQHPNAMARPWHAVPQAQG